MPERASGRGGDAKRSSESEKVEVPIPRAGFDAHERGGAPEGRGDCGWLNGVCMHGNWRTRGELANHEGGQGHRQDRPDPENCSTLPTPRAPSDCYGIHG